MELYPAIDLMDGVCVRLVKGKETSKKIYYQNPLEAALRFKEEGAKQLHVVDLDAAMGLGDNMNEIGKIIDRLDIKLQVSGGVRTLDKALSLIGMGAFRVVLGTAAITNLDFLKNAVSVLTPGKVALALDLINNKVMVEGWKRVERVDASRLIEEANRLSIGALIFTSIEVDGTLKGANLEATKKILSKLKVPMIVAGGISSLGDLEKLAEIGVEGVIIGKALYEGTINLKEAILRFS